MMNNLEVYIHIPFCVKKCDYCDFLSSKADENTKRRYVEALKKEIKLNNANMKGYLVDSVFIGGGTPSILQGESILQIMNTLRENANIKEGAEITIECNPGTVTEEKMKLFKEAGINRISFGLQSANDLELKSIGRIHTFAQFLESFNIARKCGFNNINIDLMSALPGQSIKSYKETVEKVIKLNPEHISAYSLIIEDGTKIKERVMEAESKNIKILPDEDEEREMYYMTEKLLKMAGYYRYEISNYAKKGMECRHNEGYWRRVDYLGFGLGASSLYNKERFNNITDIEKYINTLEKTEDEKVISNIRENIQKLSEKDEMEEYMFLGLRMTKGVSVNEFEKIFGKQYWEVYGKVTEKLIGEKLIKKGEEYISLTARGMDISNYVMSEFLQ